MFMCWVRVMSSPEYSIILVDPNPICLVNVSRILDPNMTYLLIRSTWHETLTYLINKSHLTWITCINFHIFKIKIQLQPRGQCFVHRIEIFQVLLKHQLEPKCIQRFVDQVKLMKPNWLQLLDKSLRMDLGVMN